MTDIENKKRSMEESLQRIKDKHQGTPATASAPFEPEADDLSARLQEWEASLDRRLDEFHRLQETGSARPIPGVALHKAEDRRRLPPSQKELPSGTNMVECFQEAETMLVGELELGRHPMPAGFKGGFEVIASEQAMKTAIAQACGLRALPDGVHLKGYQLGAFHIPGRATLINPSHYAKMEGRSAMATAISDIAMERWGWGFLLEYVSVGQKAGAAGLWPAMLADRAGLPIDDRQAGEWAAAIRTKWILLKHGWQDWVWQYVMFKAHHPLGAMVDRPRPGRIFELVIRVQELFPFSSRVFGVSIRLRSLLDLLKFIFLEQTDISPKILNQLIQEFQTLCMKHDDRVKQLVDMPLSRILGRLYFSWLENQVGILATPYAVLIAGYEPQFDFSGKSSPSGFLNYVNAEPRHNPDARLAMLARLDPRVKYNPHAMVTAAWERLKLEGPKEYFV